ncbi:MAG: metal-dependent hydrolase, partial [Pseudomonadota bacterium]|nr:metal-dependent hydrolase [Pseudomonadota bacterium]
TSLIGQEAIHSKIHNQFNDEVLKENGYPVDLLRAIADKVFEYGIYKLPNAMQLSLMAGIEHYTAVLAEFMMQHEDYLLGSQDERQRAMWMWHMLEESEHKDIAYDVFLELSGDYWVRITGFLLASLTILGGVSLGGYLMPFVRKPSNLINPRYMKDIVESTALLFGSKRGVFGSSFMHILEYLRPSFHPNDHDTTAYMEYYKERLLNPETGLLSPYFLKEFVPPVRAASA